MMLPLSYCDAMIKKGKQRYMKITGSSFSLWKVFILLIPQPVTVLFQLAKRLRRTE